MKKNLFLILAAAAMVAGCSKGEPGTIPDNSSQTPIAVTGQSMSVDTRAAFEGEVSASNTLTALVAASLTEDDYTTQYALGTMTFGVAGTAVSYASDATGNKNYPANESTSVYLAGLYPATGWGSYSTTAAITFSGKEDVMSAPQVSTTKADAIQDNYPAMVFSHLLTKLDIKVVAESADAAAAWGTIKEITLTKSQANATFCNVATVTLKDGAATFAGTAASWPIYDNSDNAITAGSIKIPTVAASVGYTLVAPITATQSADDDFMVGIKTMRNGVEYTKSNIGVTLQTTEGADFSGSTAGRSFVVTLTFKAKNIQATASVTPWVNGGNANSDVE